MKTFPGVRLFYFKTGDIFRAYMWESRVVEAAFAAVSGRMFVSRRIKANEDSGNQRGQLFAQISAH
ncbi:MAG TPA: hypothetical protein H9679_02060 [Firmicutes bacterium]|nr:hypothetical protein [Bacillota bacterium]